MREIERLKSELAATHADAEKAEAARAAAETKSTKSEGRIEALETVIAELKSQLQPRPAKHDAIDKTKT